MPNVEMTGGWRVRSGKFKHLLSFAQNASFAPSARHADLSTSGPHAGNKQNTGLSLSAVDR